MLIPYYSGTQKKLNNTKPIPVVNVFTLYRLVWCFFLDIENKNKNEIVHYLNVCDRQHRNVRVKFWGETNN